MLYMSRFRFRGSLEDFYQPYDIALPLYSHGSVQTLLPLDWASSLLVSYKWT